MINFSFSTNISSAISVMEVIPYIESFPAIRSWSIDTNAPDFLFEIETDNDTEADEIVQLIKKAGFSIILLEKSLSKPYPI